jgi:hypothetical protein
MKNFGEFTYYKVGYKLLTDCFSTCSKATIYNAHVLKLAQEKIKEANSLRKKLSKALEKYKGSDISSDKEYQELAGIVRRYQELLVKNDPLPETKESLLEYAQLLEEEFTSLNGKGMEPTFFMRAPDGKIELSTHMFLGNLKENLKIITNNSTDKKEDKIAPSKVAVGEMLTLDVKPVEKFSIASEDVIREEDGTPKLGVRPLRFQGMHGMETALSASEMLPTGTEFFVHFRVRTASPMNVNEAEPIRRLLDLGKNNGIGQWRGSGCKGQYCYKFEPVDYNPTELPEGWN